VAADSGCEHVGGFDISVPERLHSAFGTTRRMSSQQVVHLAAQIATDAHRGQFRRDSVTPYISHPEAVAKLVQGDDLAEAIAWLHDVLEDTAIKAQDLASLGLPREVIARVELLTKTDGMEYEQYLGRIKRDPVAKRVKIADMLANLGDRPSERQIVKYAKGLLILLT
jgi:(p)ppGpp synthase/HD superfamily hydrolase